MGAYVEDIVVLHRSNLRVKASEFDALREALESEPDDEGLYFAEDNIFERVRTRAGDYFVFASNDLAWYGEGSAHSLEDVFVRKVLPLFEGELDLMVHLDNGTYQGFRLRDHKVTEHRVIQALGGPV
jgi:hypothetical protein